VNPGENSKILLLYTGGTIGMVVDPETTALRAFDFSQIYEHVPELQKLHIDIEYQSFDEPIDSSNMSPSLWVKLGKQIEENYNTFDGFVILHGSDTMAYTASALSFMLKGLSKPVILTGSQLPVGTIRTDGKENLITALEIAAAKRNDQSVVREVAVYFEYNLYRGNRTHKISSENFEAFESPNYPMLAEAGVHIHYNESALWVPQEESELQLETGFDDSIAVLHLFPGWTIEYVEAFLGMKNLKCLILRTYGSGNAPDHPDFLASLKKYRDKGVSILNVSQCIKGSVLQGKYQSSKGLQEIGVLNGADITLEAAVTKCMHLLAQDIDPDSFAQQLQLPIAGEMSIMRH
jgi:L-asparaginase